MSARSTTEAEPGRVYPAWRDGRRKLVLHAVTDRRTGNTYAAGFAALCGRPVRFPVVPEFDPDDDACIECAAAVVVANPVCSTCLGEGVVERDASPEEVDAGCELGIAYDPCPSCSGARTDA